MMASVTLLGTGGPKPDPDRMASTMLVRKGGKNYLIDAGRGVTSRLVQTGVVSQDFMYFGECHLNGIHLWPNQAKHLRIRAVV